MGRVNKNKILDAIFWTSIFMITVLVFFVYLPQLLPLLLKYVYGVNPSENACDAIGQYGVLGDSYGIFNAFISLLAFGGVVYTLMEQEKDKKKEAVVSKFFSMIDYQKRLIDSIQGLDIALSKDTDGNPYYEKINGSKMFVIYKLQIKRLLKAVTDINDKKSLNLSAPDIADIAYAVFYYGAKSKWKDFMMEYLKDYPQKEILTTAILEKEKNSKRYAIGRTNQHYLSVYCRNMYNAIKLIDNASCLTEEEKKGYIKVLRAQLSNSELYILFFNLLSRFGRKWIENDFVEKYQLLQNLPSNYCDGYEPKNYFGKIDYESSSIMLSNFSAIYKV